ncbi:MAG: DNA polymerase III subunit alpha, partial [Desulfobacterales bacterium]|nr:DNA polymerase III subunit alpha [Desulfobacterales bacterium]
ALRDYRERFTRGAPEKGVSDDKIAKVWDMIMSFSGYSFCKPHSASYARVSFQAAYLKTHYPAEFIAAVISNGGGFYSTFAYVSEARRMGMTILPPDVNESNPRWKGRGDAVRVGLITIKGLSKGARERIVSERTRRPFTDMNDFLNRVRPDEAEARALVLCGALDGMNPGQGRATLMWDLAIWRRARKKQSKIRSLFPGESTAAAPALPPGDERERLRREFAVLGFLCDRHPIELYADRARELGAVKAAELPRFQGKKVRMAGWLVTGKVVRTKRGESMEFLTFEDETGVVETTFFPRTYRRFCHMIDRGRPYLLSGRVERDWGA